jgi:Ca2+-transporting ATPase
VANALGSAGKPHHLAARRSDRRLILLTLGVAALVAAAGILGGRGLYLSIETLGSTSVILADKTGTLTENRMVVGELALSDGPTLTLEPRAAQEGAFVADASGADSAPLPVLTSALRVAALCNNAELSPHDSGGLGDPTEVALLVAARGAGLEREGLLEATPELREIAFDSDARRMATLHRDGDGILAAVKGAPESVIPGCTRVAASGGTVDACQAAGIRVVMVTGDRDATASHIAAATGLIDVADGSPVSFLDARTIPSFDHLSDRDLRAVLEAPVIARATPEQKLELIALFQRQGAVVAMTGDGVNDAPALKKADIGIAMGKRGTQVAREAADMVLRDDEFQTIVAAVAQGRAIFANIRKFVLYLMSCNVTEILAVAAASLERESRPDAIRPYAYYPTFADFTDLPRDLLAASQPHVAYVEDLLAARGEAWHRERYYYRPGTYGYVWYPASLWERYREAGEFESPLAPTPAGI